MYIEKINQPSDVKRIARDDLKQLADEMRQALLTKLSRHGGHIGPNLGMVEATVALHYVFDSPRDKMVYDVSHQSYPHKMLTGRRDAFLYEEHYDDVSGYTNPKESEHDFFTVGHTSTSISLACGLAKARDLRGESGNVIAVIGDGSLSGGEALEGLDYAAELGGNLIILVNDNDMSIAENHGRLYENLKLLRETNGSAECNLFKALHLDYRFVGDGHDINALVDTFDEVKDCKHAVVVHIVTQKGKGFAPAEADRERWHAGGPFNLQTGVPVYDGGEGETLDSVTAAYFREKMVHDQTVVCISAGTPMIFKFTPHERRALGAQFVDVGIAEETAVALASGIAKGGGKPVFNVYSPFIQRTYDQISQDLCLNNNPATILVNLTGVFGLNDETHLGIFDIPLLANIPNLVYLVPTTKEEYLAMLDWSIEQQEHPVAIRMPGGEMVSDGKQVTRDFGKLNVYEKTQAGSGVAILGLGNFYGIAEQTAGLLSQTQGIAPTLIKPYYISGMDEQLLRALVAEHQLVVTLEDGVLDGGFGQEIASFYGNSGMKVLNYGLKKEFIDRFQPGDILKGNRLTPEQIAQDIIAILTQN